MTGVSERSSLRAGGGWLKRRRLQLQVAGVHGVHHIRAVPQEGNTGARGRRACGAEPGSSPCGRCGSQRQRGRAPEPGHVADRARLVAVPAAREDGVGALYVVRAARSLWRVSLTVFFLNPCCRAAIQMCARGTRIARSCYRCARTRVSICPARPSSARLRRSWNASTSSRREIGRRSARRGAECSYVWSFSWILRLTSSEFPNNLCMRSSLLLDSAIDFRISTVSSIVRAASVYLSR